MPIKDDSEEVEDDKSGCGHHPEDDKDYDFAVEGVQVGHTCTSSPLSPCLAGSSTFGRLPQPRSPCDRAHFYSKGELLAGLILIRLAI